MKPPLSIRIHDKHRHELKMGLRRWRAKRALRGLCPGPDYKRVARDTVYLAKEKGILDKYGPCVLCGTRKHITFHHPDHWRPLFVLRVCRDCHDQIEKENQEHRLAKEVAA